MKNEQILNEIENNLSDVKEDSVVEDKVKLVVFYIENTLYALHGSLVQEVVLDYPIYYLPFVPDYFRGLINRHGEPYSIIDLKILFNNEELDGKTFLILRNKIDRISFIISSIYKIVNIDKKEIHNLTTTGNESDFFESTVTIDNNEIFIINIKTIIEKIYNDINKY